MRTQISLLTFHGGKHRLNLESLIGMFLDAPPTPPHTHTHDYMYNSLSHLPDNRNQPSIYCFYLSLTSVIVVGDNTVFYLA